MLIQASNQQILACFPDMTSQLTACCCLSSSSTDKTLWPCGIIGGIWWWGCFNTSAPNHLARWLTGEWRRASESEPKAPMGLKAFCWNKDACWALCCISRMQEKKEVHKTIIITKISTHKYTFINKGCTIYKDHYWSNWMYEFWWESANALS